MFSKEISSFRSYSISLQEISICWKEPLAKLGGLVYIWREQTYSWQLMQLRQHHISFCICSLFIDEYVDYSFILLLFFLFVSLQ